MDAAVLNVSGHIGKHFWGILNGSISEKENMAGIVGNDIPFKAIFKRL